MKTLATIVLVLGIAVFGFQSQASAANLLTDPSFESYSGAWTPLSWGQTPWEGGGGAKSGTTVGGFSSVVNLDAVTGTHSVEMFQFGTSADPTFWSYALLGQTVTGLSGNSAYSIGAAAKRLGALGAESQAYLKITWLDQYGTEGTSVDTHLTSKLSDASAENQWITLGGNFTSPTYAKGAKVMVIFDRTPCTTVPANILVDDVSFDGNAVPEPASLLLLGSGLVGLFGVSRRKK